MTLYHYTDRLSGAEILAAGVIRAQSMLLYRDMWASPPGSAIEPVVWLSTAETVDGTVVAKLLAAGWPPDLTGQVWRFCVDPPEALKLPDFIAATGMDRGLWEWAIKTGAVVGSHWRDWRLLPRDLPASEWLTVEMLTADGWRKR